MSSLHIDQQSIRYKPCFHSWIKHLYNIKKNIIKTIKKDKL